MKKGHPRGLEGGEMRVHRGAQRQQAAHKWILLVCNEPTSPAAARACGAFGGTGWREVAERSTDVAEDAR